MVIGYAWTRNKDSNGIRSTINLVEPENFSINQKSKYTDTAIIKRVCATLVNLLSRK